MQPEKLSIIIVNYNVRYFLEQALLSAKRAIKNIAAEIIVVDNNSADGSVEMVREKFPEVIVIANTKNTGFSTANNQGIKIAKGEYVLLLNPDTVLQEDTLEKCILFMDGHSDSGALGVKMIDGSGAFLPESKRGLPSPSIAFYKIFGFSALFPKSKTFGKYHLGYLPENETHEVDVLSGAFMLLRKSVLKEIGLLDETFFMYGEDIDLSYRIYKAGYKNYYFSETQIIHYKGESTKKGSLNYVRIFYGAMIIFAKKHFSKEYASSFTFLIKIAIYLKASSQLLSGFFMMLMMPLIDAAVIFLGMRFIKDYWQNNIKAAEGTIYPETFMEVIVPVYIFTWITSIFFSGGYDKPFRTQKLVRGLIAGTIIISAIYGFLDEEYRFSRAMILLGTAWAIFALTSIRLLRNSWKHKNFSLNADIVPKTIIIGEESEVKRALSLIHVAEADINYLGYVGVNETGQISNAKLGELHNLEEIVGTYGANEIIFCSKDLSYKEIINNITRLGSNKNYKILPENSNSIIGSNSKNTSGQLYAVDVNLKIASEVSRRNKRVLDIFIAFLLFLLFPINLFLVKKPIGLLRNIWLTITGKKTWVSYLQQEYGPVKLPKIKEGILPIIKPHKANINFARLNYLYAKNYSINKDLQIIFNNYKDLGA